MANHVPPAAAARVARSLVLGLQTRLRRARMAPRRRRVVAALCTPPGPRTVAPPPAPGDQGRPPRVLVIAHVYHPDLWPELAAAVDRIGVPAEVLVSLVTGASDHLAPTVKQRFPGATVEVAANRGRDMLPLVRALDRIDGHDVVLKLHSKRSPHRRRGDRWRTRSLDDLCGSPERVAAILRVLADPRIGMVAPDGCVLGREFLGPNRRLVHDLAHRGGVPLDEPALWFPAGSMFWARPEALEPLRHLALTDADFAPETGALDATLAHALERYLGVALATAGLAVVEARDVPRILAGRMAP